MGSSGKRNRVSLWGWKLLNQTQWNSSIQKEYHRLRKSIIFTTINIKSLPVNQDCQPKRNCHEDVIRLSIWATNNFEQFIRKWQKLSTKQHGYSLRKIPNTWMFAIKAANTTQNIGFEEIKRAKASNSKNIRVSRDNQSNSKTPGNRTKQNEW